MLQANPTESGTGISIYGDYAYLDSLYESAHQIADSLLPALAKANNCEMHELQLSHFPDNK